MPLQWSVLIALSLLLSPLQPQISHSRTGSQTASSSGNKSQNEKDTDRNEPDKHDIIRPQDVHDAILWRHPGNMTAENLFYGQGGKENEPVAPFEFLEEDREQSTPKFDVRDANGKKWRAKLGQEARPEVVASRLLWAVGYFVEDDYVVRSADVTGLHMRRGKKYIHGEHTTDTRFARRPDGQKKIATWRWRQNPFTGTRELNGLRVMMALLNSWDLKDENNAVFEDKKTGRELFLVSDTGTSFGRNGLHFTNGPSKDNVKAYVHSKFILKTTPTYVDFATPAPSPSLLMETLGFGVKQFVRRERMLWIGRHIPRADARWIGELLGQLSHEQLVDAFRAGDYPPDQIDAFVGTVEKRIHALQAL